jgi:ankyrin repeat protein
MTALMYAVKHGARDVIRILIKHKADLLITDAVSKNNKLMFSTVNGKLGGRIGRWGVPQQ